MKKIDADLVERVSSLLEQPPYGLPHAEKRAVLEPILVALTRFHSEACAPYGRFVEGTAEQFEPAALEDVPALPVRLFKLFELSSVPREEIFKTLSSSGTTGQVASRVYLDATTSRLQTRALVRILQVPLGRTRLPMLIADHPSVVKDRASFSARGAGILGLSTFGRDHTYALRDDLSLDLAALDAFEERHAGGRVLVFGFTFMVWEYLVRALEAEGRRLRFDSGVLLHSGGWKKLEQRAVPKPTFRERCHGQLGIADVFDFYGMAEQVGSIFLECSAGRLHAPSFADVVVRDLRDGCALGFGRDGVLQVLSALPLSYPGHSLLTEDRGRLLGEDDCPCGRLGRTFEVLGRLPRAELRG